MTELDRIMFGDNQFFGINHMSEEKARAQAMRFRDAASIVRVLDDAYAAGIRSFMCTTHDAIAEVAAQIAADPGRFEGFKFLPGMPYAHKYANMVGELGPVGTVRQLAPGGVIEAIGRGARTAMRGDVEALMAALVDAELAPLHGVDTPVVFLQNVVTDLLLGLGTHSLFPAFRDYLRERHSAEVGFFTMNMPRLVDVLVAHGIPDPIVCCNYNKIGFRMSGGIEAYDRALRDTPVRCIAMSVLASGAIEPSEAIEWICERPGIESIVFGASSRSHIRQTVDLINEHSG